MLRFADNDVNTLAVKQIACYFMREWKDVKVTETVPAQ